ncbi:hypothetical protein ACINK0_18815 (plasmid) [Deinococcus sp. VB343]|uniref:hypothetical protein n=1 Tax=Deinococcus sp. VB343 TaxID=3385567 RepID=UPI0039C9C2E1
MTTTCLPDLPDLLALPTGAPVSAARYDVQGRPLALAVRVQGEHAARHLSALLDVSTSAAILVEAGQDFHVWYCPDITSAHACLRVIVPGNAGRLKPRSHPPLTFELDDGMEAQRPVLATFRPGPQLYTQVAAWLTQEALACAAGQENRHDPL